MAYYRKLTGDWRLSDGILGENLLAEPCDVASALREAGRLPDPEKGMNALGCEWISGRRWTYSVGFDAPEGDEERCMLALGRVAGSGSVYLNGECQGTFVSGAAQFDLTGSLRPGGNALSVVFEPALYARPEHEAPVAPIGLLEAPLLRWNSCVTVDQVRLSSHLQGDTGVIECEVDLTAHVSGKYVFVYTVSRDAEPVQRRELEERLPAAARKLAHRLEIDAPVRYDRAQPDETVYSVRLSIERAGVGCEIYHMETAFREAHSGRRCLAVHEWPLSQESAQRLIELNADAVLPLNAPPVLPVENDFLHGLTVVRAGEGMSETGMLTEQSMKAYADGELYWPADGAIWKLRGGTLPDTAQMRSLTGEGVSMGAQRYAKLVRYLQAARLTRRLDELRRQGKRAIVPADEPFAYFASDALLERDGCARPAAHAVRAAWQARHVFAQTPESARPGDALTIPVWVADEQTHGETLCVQARAYTMQGSELAGAEYTAMSGDVRQAGTLLLNLPQEEGIIIVRAEMKNMEGRLLDRSDSILCVSAEEPLRPLVRAEAAQLSMEKGLLRSVGGAAAISAGQCLLPGESSAQAADEWLNV